MKIIKGILIALMLMGLSTGAMAGEMEDVMLSIEKDLDTCIESNDKKIEQLIFKYEAEIITGAISNKLKGLYIPPVKYKRRAN